MRVYLPVSQSQIGDLAKGNRLSELAGYALTPEWAQSQGDQDPEFLEEVMLYTAASDCQERRIVVVAEIGADLKNSAAGQVQIQGELGLKQIQALFADDAQNQVAIASGADPADLDMTWFGPTECHNLVEFLEQ